MRADRLPVMATEVTVRPTSDLDRWADDFPGFAALLDIVPKEGSRQKLRPNAIQTAFEVSRSGRDIVLKPRQVGLTTWELARDIWFFLTRQGARVMIVCQSDKDNEAINGISAKIRLMFESLAAAGVHVPFRSESSTQWVLAGRGSSLHLTGAGASEKAAAKKGRGGTIHRLHVTELAFFDYPKITMNALMECVSNADDTEIVIESTANGAAGLFHDSYQDAVAGKTGYRPHFFRWMSQPEYATPLEPGETITPQTPREAEMVKKHGATSEQVKWFRGKVADKGSQDLVDQEYPTDPETCWLTAGRVFLNVERTKVLLTESCDPLIVEALAGPAKNHLHIWALPNGRDAYVIIADPSEGIGGDPGAGAVYHRDTGEHVASIHGQFPTWEFARELATLGHRYNDAEIVVERNNHGHAVLQALEHGQVVIDDEGNTVEGQRYPNIYVGVDGRLGWVSTPVSRATAVEAFESAHRTSEWSSPDREALNEMLKFVVWPDGKPRAANGAHDDRVMTHVVAQFVLSRPRPGPAKVVTGSGSRFGDSDRGF